MSSGILIGTITFIIIGAIVYAVSHYKINKMSFIDNKKRDDYISLARGVVLMSTVCMWIHWICCYLHQMNPLIQPIPSKHE